MRTIIAECFYSVVLVDTVNVISSQWQALFCDIGLFRLIVSKNVWAFACGDLDFRWILECLLLACLLYDWWLDRCLATWLTDYSQI